MKTLNKEQILSAVTAIRGGRIGRLTYMTDVPVKAEFKKQGYKITKIVESSVRFGVNYHNIASVTERKSEQSTVTNTRANNYEWVIKNRIKHNNKTDKDYLVVANLPVNDNIKVKYILQGSTIGIIDMGTEIAHNYKEIVIDSYFKKAFEKPEIRTIAFENIIRINNLGDRVSF